MVVCAVLLAGPMSARDGIMVAVRWLPSGSPDVAGYLVHLRRLDGGQDHIDQDVGLPPSGGDGTERVILGPLNAGIDYAVSVGAFGADGVEGPRSNELILWAQLCCAEGACASSVQPLGTTTFAVRRTRAGGRLVVRGSYPVGAALDPTATGVRIEVRGADRTPLYRVQVPAHAFRTNRRRSLFRYRAGRRRRGAGGLSRLVLRADGDAVEFALAARVPRLDPTGAQAPAAFTLQMGEECARVNTLDCGTADRGRFRCQ